VPAELCVPAVHEHGPGDAAEEELSRFAPALVLGLQVDELGDEGQLCRVEAEVLGDALTGLVEPWRDEVVAVLQVPDLGFGLGALVLQRPLLLTQGARFLLEAVLELVPTGQGAAGLVLQGVELGGADRQRVHRRAGSELGAGAADGPERRVEFLAAQRQCGERVAAAVALQLLVFQQLLPQPAHIGVGGVLITLGGVAALLGRCRLGLQQPLLGPRGPQRHGPVRRCGAEAESVEQLVLGAGLLERGVHLDDGSEGVDLLVGGAHEHIRGLELAEVLHGLLGGVVRPGLFQDHLLEQPVDGGDGAARLNACEQSQRLGAVAVAADAEPDVEPVAPLGVALGEHEVGVAAVDLAVVEPLGGERLEVADVELADALGEVDLHVVGAGGVGGGVVHAHAGVPAAVGVLPGCGDS
jgi:hypothetical protein